MFDRWTLAWLGVCAALAVHLADEVINGSTGLYGDFVQLFSFLFPFLELPTFRREIWLINLGGAIVVLFALTWMVARRRSPMAAASYLLAAFVTLNGVLHLTTAVAVRHMIPGAWTASLLVVTGLLLFLAVPRERSAHA